MLEFFYTILLFATKFFIVLIFIFLLLIGILAIFSKAKHPKNLLKVTYLNDEYEEAAETILTHSSTKKTIKEYFKHKKASHKLKEKQTTTTKKIYVINFHGDVRATAVNSLTHEMNAILKVVTPQDEVVVRLESAGGVVHGYGLAAAQLLRLREKNIPLTIFVDKVAASGGYLMASVANKIYAAPFAIIGSIGVIMQLPNFHRYLKDKNIDFEQQTAGEYKRTLTVFGENTEEGREKLREELNKVHAQFKDFVTSNRQLDIAKVATGEHWLAKEALQYGLIDGLKTSDDYLLEQSKTADLYEVSYESKKSLLSKLLGA